MRPDFSPLVQDVNQAGVTRQAAMGAEADATRLRGDIEVAKNAALQPMRERIPQQVEEQARQMQAFDNTVREYVENHSRAELLDAVLDEELPRYAEALERLGQ